MAVEFWNRQFSQQRDRAPDDSRRTADRPAPYERALEHFGDVRGRTVVDLGCGDGEASRFFAARGARVHAVDTSDVAVEQLTRWCREHGVDTIEPHLLSALDVDRLGPQELVYGSMILHHLEPFAEFADSLRRALDPHGRAYFYENNGASRTMLWFRANVVGRFGVPKYGDDDEFPLTPAEVDVLRRRFTVEQRFPEFLYLELATTYLLHGRLQQPARRADELLHRCESLRRYSYRQELRLS
jgi:2-polyprenyl-3-methyl-5-hydroxy-6-metoxy-1,4-benzoquinol methylase